MTVPFTNPKSVVSSSNSAARPAPIDDLYYTKSVFGAAWSPDGQQIVFTSDIAGRFNLWKVSAPGGWPIQLTQSDDRQYNAAWSPDGKWIVYQQDRAGDELWDLSESGAAEITIQGVFVVTDNSWAFL